MPFIKVQWVAGRTREQKAQLAEKITEAFIEIAKVSRDHVWIAFEDVERSCWSMEGKLLDEK